MSKAIRYYDKSKTFFDGSSVAAGYQLFQYQAGTTTKANTYTTAAKSVANSNPMTLNASGRLDQDIYIDQSMKFVVATLAASDPPTSSIMTVDNAVANAQVWATVAKTGDYTVLETDRDKLIKADATSGTLTVTLLAAATAGDGFRLAVKKTDSGSNTVIIDGNASETLDGNATYTIRNQNEAILFVCDGTNWQIFNSASSADIYDANGNEEIIFTSTASAVNEFTFANAATGTDVSITASGGDTNVGIDITAKGTGTVDITGAALTVGNGATGAGELRLLEDSDNGTNYMGFKSPAAVTTSLSLVLPDGDGTSGQYLSTNASGTLAWSSVVSQANQTAMEAETNEDTYVAPDMVRYNPGVAKAWLNYNQSGSPAITGSYNITSVTDEGTGVFSVIIATDFSDATYTVAACAGPAANTSVAVICSLQTSTPLAAGIADFQVNNSSGTLGDYSFIGLTFLGDQ